MRGYNSNLASFARAFNYTKGFVFGSIRGHLGSQPVGAIFPYLPKETQDDINEMSRLAKKVHERMNYPETKEMFLKLTKEET